MEMRPSHYDPITMETLTTFAQGFPKFSQPSNFELHKEKDEVVFGSFDVLVSDRLIITAPPFITYVPSGRNVEKESTVLRHCLAILTRTPTKKISFCKMLSGSRFARPLITIEQLSDSSLIKNGWNCLFLFEKENPKQVIQLLREVKNNETFVGFTNSSIQKQVIEN
jgi:hypothetical protein